MTDLEPRCFGSIKICGLREPEHAVVAAKAGADMIGFIFAPTRRYVAPEDARRAVDAAREAVSGDFQAVGVFVNTPISDINDVVETAGLDFVQVSGDESPDDLQGVSRPVLRALRPPAGATVAEISEEVTRWRAALPGVRLLVDGFHPGHFGGTGVRTDWRRAAELTRLHPIVLAGGLDPENVSDAIAAVRPVGVDVSSGVEIDGRKDSALIQAFVARARAVFSSLVPER